MSQLFLFVFSIAEKCLSFTLIFSFHILVALSGCVIFICLQVAGFGHGNDTLLHTERHTQGSVQKYSKDTQVFPDLCIS